MIIAFAESRTGHATCPWYNEYFLSSMLILSKVDAVGESIHSSQLASSFNLSEHV